jgi:very-short-patch-repair endonuclease
MVSAPNERGAALSRDTFAHRFNVAASRARDRMYLVRSVGLEHLSEADRLRRSLISHFTAPFAQDESRVADLRSLCESPFEREMYDELTQRGFWVTPQVRVGQYRIDMVVEGHNDARLAVECDGDQYHGADKWADDMQRQRVLERAGWVFWRCFASAFVRRRQAVLADLLTALEVRGIGPMDAESTPRSVHTEQRIVQVAREDAGSELGDLPDSPTTAAKLMVVHSSVPSSVNGTRHFEEQQISIPTTTDLFDVAHKPADTAGGNEKDRANHPVCPLHDEVAKFCETHGLQFNRVSMNGGLSRVLLVKHNGARGEIANQLRAWGFVSKYGAWEKSV